jgi:hypothetical protein
MSFAGVGEGECFGESEGRSRALNFDGEIISFSRTSRRISSSKLDGGRRMQFSSMICSE